MSKMKKFNDTAQAINGLHCMSDQEIVQTLASVIKGHPLILDHNMIERGQHDASPFFKLSKRVEDKSAIQRLVKPLKKKGAPIPVFVADKGEHLSNLMWLDQAGAVFPRQQAGGQRVDFVTFPKNKDYGEDTFIKDGFIMISFSGKHPLMIPREPLRKALRQVIREKGSAHFLAAHFARNEQKKFGCEALYKCGLFLTTLETGKMKNDITAEEMATTLKDWFSPDSLKALLHVDQDKGTELAIAEQGLLELIHAISGTAYHDKTISILRLGKIITSDLQRLEDLENRTSPFAPSSRRNGRPTP